MSQKRAPEKLADIVSSRLQQIEDRLPSGKRVSIVVPKGVVRTVDTILPDYDFVSNPTVRRNICYAVEALDFYRWIINRFRLYGPVSAYLYKTGIILVDMVIEALTRDLLEQKGVSLSKSRAKNISKLSKHGVPSSLCERMRKLHERRGNIHLHRVSDLEATKYTVQDWNKCIRCLQAVREGLHRALCGGS